MPIKYVNTDPVAEKSTMLYSGIIKDETGSAIASASLTTLTLTLYNCRDQSIINGVDGLNILNTGRGTVNSAGKCVVTLTPDDNVVLDRTQRPEKHGMALVWTYSSGTKTGRHEVEFYVMPMTRQP